LYTALPHLYPSSQKEHGVKRFLIGLGLVFGLVGAVETAYAGAGGQPTVSGSVEDEKAPKQLPFYGLSFDFTVSDGTGLNSVGQNYRNDLAFYFEPSWAVGARFLKHTWAKTLTLAARFAVTQELSGTDDASFNGSSNAGPHGTCSNINPINGVVDPTQVGYCNPASNDRRADYSDLWLTVKMPRVYTIPKAEIAISPAVRFIFPTSMQSRFQTLVMGITPSLSLSRGFWKDRIHIGYGVGYTKNIHQSTIAGLDPKTGGSAATDGSNPYDGAVGTSISNFYADPSRVSSVGGFNVSQSVSQTFSGSIQITDKLGFDALYILVSPFTYVEGNYCTTMVNGQPYDLCGAGDSVAASSGSTLNRGTKGMTQVLWLTLGYQALDWLNVSVAWINWAPTYYGNGSYRNGFISTDYNAFTTVQLGMTVTIDKLAQRFRKN
jgi:hypothetical protein